MQRIAVAATSLAFLFSLAGPAGATSIPLTLDPSQITSEGGFSRWTIELNFGDLVPDASGGFSQHFAFTGPNKLKVSDFGLALPLQDEARTALKEQHALLQLEIAKQQGKLAKGQKDLADLHKQKQKTEADRDLAKSKADQFDKTATKAEKDELLAKKQAEFLEAQKVAYQQQLLGLQKLLENTADLTPQEIQQLINAISDLTGQIADKQMEIVEKNLEAAKKAGEKQQAKGQKKLHDDLKADLEEALVPIGAAIGAKEGELAPLQDELTSQEKHLAILAAKLAALPDGALAEAFELILTDLNGQPIDLPFIGELLLDIDPALAYSVLFDDQFQFAELTDGDAFISGLTINLEFLEQMNALLNGPTFDKLTLSLIADQIDVASIVQVPQPTTLALLPAGLLMAGWLRRRRRQEARWQ